MLTHLLVKNVALVDHLELAFDHGMSVITGETGAGKSIMLDALGLALGDRAESGLIARDAEKCEVHASFDLGDNQLASDWLSERELDADGECILRRVVSRDGRSRGFINGAPVNVSDLKSLGDMLIDIHSQHEHQSLLKRDTHRRLLDGFAHEMELADKVRELAEEFAERRQQLSELIARNEEQSSRVQLLTYQAEELETLATTETEAGELESEQKLLANAESILSACNEAAQLISENEEDNALSHVARAIQLISTVDQDRARAIVEMLESSRIQMQEAAHDLVRFSEDVDLDPARLKVVENRLSELYDAARKHRIEPSEIPALQIRIADERAQLSNVDAEIESLQAELEDIQARYKKDAGALGAARTKAAKQLAARVSKQLSQLGMEGAVFEVSLSKRADPTPNPRGNEDIEFLVSTNPGAEPRALNRVASGGELSRISLAIQVVTADTSEVPTLVFDEVDVGIGGAVAEVVGTSLRQLGKKAQIICVTHLPQVAAQGHHHYRATKTSDDKHAITDITPLPEDEKVPEIARMLGGVELTEQSLAHAEEMYSAAQAG